MSKLPRLRRKSLLPGNLTAKTRTSMRRLNGGNSRQASRRSTWLLRGGGGPVSGGRHVSGGCSEAGLRRGRVGVLGLEGRRSRKGRGESRNVREDHRPNPPREKENEAASDLQRPPTRPVQQNHAASKAFGDLISPKMPSACSSRIILKTAVTLPAEHKFRGASGVDGG